MTAVDAGMIRANPTAGVKPPSYQPREMLFLSPEQIEDLADIIDERFRPLVLTAAYTGARAGELLALDRENVDLLRRRVRFASQISTATARRGPMKSRKARTVVIPPFLADVRDRSRPDPAD